MIRRPAVRVLGVVALVAGFLAVAPRHVDACCVNDLANRYYFSLDRGAGTLTGGAGPGVSRLYAGTIAFAAGSDVNYFGKDLGENEVLASDGSLAYQPFAAGFKGGVTVAAGNIDGDPGIETVAGQQSGGSLVRVFDDTPGGNPPKLHEFQAYENGFSGGVRVVLADFDGNGTKELIVAPGPGRAPTVKVFTLAGTLVTSADVFASTFAGGVFVAAANLDGDAAAEVVVGAGAGGGPHVKVLNGLTDQIGGFFAFGPSEGNGVRVAAGVLNGGPAVVATTRTPATGYVRAFSPQGAALSNPQFVQNATGDLSVAIAGDAIRMVDASPRFIGFTPDELEWRDHTRVRRALRGQALVEQIEDVEMGTDQDPVLLSLVGPSDDDVAVDVDIPAGVYGSQPVTVTVRTVGGGTTYRLQANGPLIAGRQVPLRDFVTTGVYSKGGPHIRMFTAEGSENDGVMRGAIGGGNGVRVARGDLDGDGIDEVITGSPPGEPPVVQVHSANFQATRLSFEPYPHNFFGGVNVAVADIDRSDPGMEIVTGADAGGGPHVRVWAPQGGVNNVFTGAELVSEFMAYAQEFAGGVRVAAGDVDGDGVGDIITAPGPGGGPHVRTWDGAGTEIGGFMAYAPIFTGGVTIAALDGDGDGVDEVVTGPGAGGGPHVRVFDAEGFELAGFMAFTPGFTGGVAVGRVGDDILGPNLIAVGAGPGGGPHVKVMAPDGTEVDGFYAYGPLFSGGVLVAGGLA